MSMVMRLPKHGWSHRCISRRLLSLGPASITHPVSESAKVLRHIQHTKIIPFTEGLDIQEKLVRAQLDLKKIHAKIRAQLADWEKHRAADASLNPNELQIIDQIFAMKPHPTVLTFEFEPTYTGGKRIKKSLTQEQVAQFESFKPATQVDNPAPKFVQVERGGEITFHGPSQMVAYVLLDLKDFHDFSARGLVKAIEWATINVLKHLKVNDRETLDIDAKLTNKTGVWAVDGKKIASLGIHVRRSITSHGVAINVDTDLSYMNSFEMCGSPGVKATSIKEQRPDIDNISTGDVAVQFVRELAKILGINIMERMAAEDSNEQK
ncbi:lipoyl(octanoyl) transferase LIP2 KNAG_0A02610 [Huiozyma naganishii CBS 8797]|uniref:Octanoyltransferase n=1 Tax=Huiozyma naganishii (strain ATCC MYA-139 / BCRC 22969 / CBS 8797 / KCTC 17520 / NBRC 10181 / NCYC 3082 / Yp74L-3) TaxID=1071383 RepID=J7QZM8_HUIN7|nr:hypothetical protein KNAG_0A02610 [Kazachstania naganishii CBS 8797]CCK67950.1 hypothetical protein KNAG_0A02610 [Kazachstania naganishii CBS 8797]